MCGIAGIISQEKSIPNESIKKTIERLYHRGPDTQNSIQLDRCHLGHTRLSIIDLSGGTQPMSDRTQRYWLVFNGEIFNYQELRQQLEKQGWNFDTNSDTEVLLKSYLAYGESALSYLKGQFAFAIWDTKERKLFAARDRFGEKPFYYCHCDRGYFLFASEIKALLASNLVTPKIDLVSVDAYLGLLYVPPERTIYENIYTLKPAHAITWQNGKTQEWRYWQPKYSQETLQPQEAIEKLKYLIDRAVQRQTVADVPVGAFLSGGLDSSSIVALMSQYSDRKIKTFSVGFGDLINELPYARSVAKTYNTDHQELHTEIPVGELLEEMVEVYDEPFADSSNIPTYLISKFASQQVKVVLSGDGGDELFGGYEWYSWLLEAEYNPKQRFLSQLRLNQFFLRILRKLRFPVTQQCNLAIDRYQKQKLIDTYPDYWDRHLAYATGLKNDRSLLWNKQLNTQQSIEHYYYPQESLQKMDRVTDFDLQCYLTGDILVKVDRASMAHGLESRSPFLDVDLVEFVLGLPWQLRFQDSNRKHLLKQACQHLWPQSIHNRTKQGFGAPIWQWIERPDVQLLLTKVCQSNQALIHLLPNLKTALPFFSPQQKWTILCLGLWLEQHSECLNHLWFP
jgi:asparagine synthase (glutamine-hydrolysing)